jgi:hypothetical protein
MIRPLSVAAMCLLAACAGTREEATGPELPPELLRCFLLETDDLAPTRPGREGPVAGEIVCHPPEAWEEVGRYRIVLYREPLLNHDVSRLYNTIAHEFKHVLQDVAGEGAVNCGQFAKDSRLRAYEKEASRWADRIAPLTDCGTRNR